MRKQLDAEPAVQHTDSLHTKYRPAKLAQVLGQAAVVKSLQAAIKAKARAHTYLFTGPAGTGKTTLARILAKEMGCGSIVEVDASSNSGIDDMRRITEALQYQGFGDEPGRAIILNECQGLSKNAWDSLLTATEEPPEHVFFFFTSTHPAKIPAAMMTRAVSYHLVALKFDVIMDLLEQVCDDEGFDTKSSILRMVAEASGGSMRMALTMLAKVHACDDDKEAGALLQSSMDNAQIIDLCRQMVSGRAEWRDVVKTLKELEEPPETIRIIIVNYLNACVMGAKSDKDAVRLLDMLECFLKPCNPSDKLAPLLVAFGRYLFD